MTKTYLCYCEKGKHTVEYTDTWKAYDAITYGLPKIIQVHSMVSGKTYHIPRIWIAMHGLLERELNTLGFPEVDK